MKPESIPFFGLGVAVVLGVLWFVVAYDGFTFPEPESQQFCAPQVQTESFRWGRVGAGLDLEAVEPLMLVRYKTPRTIREVTSRVYATQGQRVKIEAGEVYVDGKVVEDPYARNRSKADFLPEMVVPADSLFVLNDVRSRRGSDRKDSRAFGPIPFRAVTYVFSAKEKDSGGRR
jgi:hypothetical protein